jgi:hypothetical protein
MPRWALAPHSLGQNCPGGYRRDGLLLGYLLIGFGTNLHRLGPRSGLGSVGTSPRRCSFGPSTRRRALPRSPRGVGASSMVRWRSAGAQSVIAPAMGVRHTLIHLAERRRCLQYMCGLHERPKPPHSRRFSLPRHCIDEPRRLVGRRRLEVPGTMPRVRFWYVDRSTCSSVYVLSSRGRSAARRRPPG